MWLYYPNKNAYKAVIFFRFTYSEDKYYHEVALRQHEHLNGAYIFRRYYLKYEDIERKFSSSSVPYFYCCLSLTGFQDSKGDNISVNTSPDPTIDIQNKIYTSEVNNPFVFLPENIYTVGIGSVLGICSAVKALSQGQFGQFPLYAFTTNGVWALEVSSTGSFSAKQPVSRDVCINPDSITQIDSSVLFATERGIMKIRGSETECVSGAINTRHPFAFDTLPAASEIIGIFNDKAGEHEQVSLSTVTQKPFLEFLQGCRMAYDYVNRHVVVYNPDVEYAYVLSIESGQWGMMNSEIVSHVNSYPDALVVLRRTKADGTPYQVVADLSAPDPDATSAATLVVTRPLKLGAPDTLKTVDTVIQRGFFRREHVAQVLYGSRDLFNWHVVASSKDMYLRVFRGTPYKYFRLVLVCKLDDGESIQGCTVQFTPRLTDRPR